MIADIQTTPLSAANFNYVRDFVAAEAAIVIDPGKEYLIETRLANLATRNNCASVNALIDVVRAAGASAQPLRAEIVEALTTNETLFFRDLHPFDALREHIIPDFQRRAPGATFRVWSAAASTGQEAYSIAMLFEEHFPGQPAHIHGTDLSSAVIARARAGAYQQIEVNRGLPAKLLMKYFHRQDSAWQLNDVIRRRVTFAELNLVRRWPPMLPFHVVFLRNVLIYFDVETRRNILRQIKGVLAPGGYLALGGAETTTLIDPDFVPTPVGRATLYRLG